MTDSGPVLVVNFADGSTRSLLATPSFWLTLPDLAAIPVAKAAAPEPEPEEEMDEPVVEKMLSLSWLDSHRGAQPDYQRVRRKFTLIYRAFRICGRADPSSHQRLSV